MEAQLERRLIVRKQLTQVIGKAEEFLLIEQPPKRELNELLKTLTEQDDCLTRIDRQIENTVDIDHIEEVMFDAFDFVSRVVSAKVQTGSGNIRGQNESASCHCVYLKTRIRSELRPHRNDEEIDAEDLETPNEKNNSGPPKYEGHYRPALDLQNMPPTENDCLGCCAANTSCNLADSDCLEQTAIFPNMATPAHLEIVFDDLKIGDRTSTVTDLTLSCVETTTPRKRNETLVCIAT